MDARKFWTEVVQSPKLILAPMVDHSELPWRMLSREYGCQAAYTPMFHGVSFATSKKYRQRNFSTCPEDRPLFVQFCANKADVLLQAAKYVENDCNGVDINLGCPQDIARRGHYGAFLQDEWELIDEMVTKLRTNMRNDLGVSCKIRRFEELNKTLDYARMLERAGCTFITLHARTKEQRGVTTGVADWSHIRAVKESICIPVIANGNIQSLRDVEECLEFTKADAVMTAEGNLYNPAIFHNVHPPAWKVARRYLYYVARYPIPIGIAKSHIFKLFHRCLGIEADRELYIKLGESRSLEALKELINLIEERYARKDCDQTIPINVLPVPPYLCQPRHRYNVAPKAFVEKPDNEKQSKQCFDARDGVSKRIKLNVC